MAVDPRFADLVPGYIASRRAEIDDLRALFAAADYAGIRAVAHRLHGTGGTYGRPDLSAIGAELETACEHGDAADVARGIEALAEALAGDRP